MKGKRPSRISILITTCRRPEGLRATLDSLNAQITNVHAECIVVDNDPKGSARSIVEQYQFSKKWELHYVHETKPGKIYGLNAGILRATCEYILDYDDDVILDPHNLESYLEAMEAHPEASYFGGPVISECHPEVPKGYEVRGPYRLYLTWPDHDLGLKTKYYEKNEMPIGSNRVFRKSLFQQGVRFDVTMLENGQKWNAADDIGYGEQLHAAGMKIVYVPRASVRHTVSRKTFTFKNLWQRYYWYGKYQTLNQEPNQRTFAKEKYIYRDLLGFTLRFLKGWLTLNWPEKNYCLCEIARCAGFISEMHKRLFQIRRLKTKKGESKLPSTTKPEVSVVIITRNRSFILGDCLDALKPQVVPEKHEVIVVDSSERDDTKALMERYPWVCYHRITLPLGTRPQSYSYGAQKSRAEIVALLDDDAIVFPGWLEGIAKGYERNDIGGVGGRVLPKEKLSMNLNRSDLPIGTVDSKGSFIGNLYLDPGESREVDTLRGCNMSVRRELLEQMNFFDVRFRGQNCRVEDDICFWVKRMGHKIIFDPKVAVRHLAEERPDIPRSEFSARSEFYVWRNTVWLYAKHFGLRPKILFKIGVFRPLIMGLRRVFGGSLKSPKISTQSIAYLPSACAGFLGGLWGVLMSLAYKFQDGLGQEQNRSLPKLGRGQFHVLGDQVVSV